MTTYSAEQVTAVEDADALGILTERGLPDNHIAPFRPVSEPTFYNNDPQLLMIGNWDIDQIPVCLDLTDGMVVGIDPKRQESYVVNTSLRRFVDSLDAITQATPLSPANPAYSSYEEAADAVRTALTRIDGEAFNLGDFWETLIDDIAVGGIYDE